MPCYAAFFFPKYAQSLKAGMAINNAGIKAIASRLPRALADVPEGHCTNSIVVCYENADKAKAVVDGLGEQCRDYKMLEIDRQSASENFSPFLKLWDSVAW